MKRKKIDELTEIARKKNLTALDGFTFSKKARELITVGTFINDSDNNVVFELYIAGQKPQDAIVITRTILNRYTGEGETEVLIENKSFFSD